MPVAASKSIAAKTWRQAVRVGGVTGIEPCLVGVSEGAV